MDKLDIAIAETEKGLAEVRNEMLRLRRKRTILWAKLEAFNLAAEARPVLAEPEIRRGRQPGAISGQWREILRLIYMLGAVNYNGIQEIARGQGLDIELASLRERVRLFLSHDYMQGDVDNGFTVTDFAADKFGFRSSKNASDDDSVIDLYVDSLRRGRKY